MEFKLTKNEKWERKYKYGSEENLLNKVQLEITSACNLKCHNCDRSCGQAPSEEQMDVEDIKSFLLDIDHYEWKWDRIDILGGEPSLHPKLYKIFRLLVAYKIYNPKCKFRYTTNGVGPLAELAEMMVPRWTSVRNSKKDKKKHSFVAYNLAPCDFGYDDPPVCDIPWRCGLALTKNGYYLCGAGAAIDRVFQFGIGIEKLGDVSVQTLAEQSKILCRLCGHAPTPVRKRTDKEEISKTLAKAYENYNRA